MEEDKFDKMLTKLEDTLKINPLNELLAKSFAVFFKNDDLDESLTNLNFSDGIDIEDIVYELMVKMENVFDEILEVGKVEYSDESVSAFNKIKIQDVIEILKSTPTDLQRHVVQETLHRIEKIEYIFVV
jgi:hypothetical protein